MHASAFGGYELVSCVRLGACTSAPILAHLGILFRLWPNLGTAAFVFNCQMGRGRTTTGTIIASLLYLRKLQAFPPTPTPAPTFMVPAWFTQVGSMHTYADKRNAKCVSVFANSCNVIPVRP